MEKVSDSDSKQHVTTATPIPISIDDAGDMATTTVITDRHFRSHGDIVSEMCTWDATQEDLGSGHTVSPHGTGKVPIAVCRVR